MSMQSASGAAPSTLRVVGDGHRYRLVLKALRTDVETIAKDAEMDPAHLQRVVNGERPATAKVADELRLAVGDAGWAYAIGESARLPMEGEK